MKKIILIEDREERQKLFMEDTELDLSLYDDILENTIGDKYEIIYEKLKNNTFNFDDYETIIVHKSAFHDDNRIILNKIRKHCQASKDKQLILFSGGITTNYYDNSECETIELNSKVFYSNNLKLFLEDAKMTKPNLLILSYGAQWELNSLLNVLEKINFFIEENRTEKYIIYTDFERETDFTLLHNFDFNLDESKIEDDVTCLDNIKELRDSINKHIEKEVLNA